MATTNQTSINIPQLLAVAVVGFFAIRWYLSKPASTNTNSTTTTSSRSVDSTKILQVSSMFPQLDQRSIAWDLSRNGNNVEATTERILGGRGLETPPPSFQPANLPGVPSTGSRSTGGGSSNSGAKGAPDLITRYGLQARVNGKGKEPEQARGSAWSADKNARADALRKRREEMILAARRKMEEKEARA